MPTAILIDATGFYCPVNGFSSDNRYLRTAIDNDGTGRGVVSGETLTFAAKVLNPGSINETQRNSMRNFLGQIHNITFRSNDGPPIPSAGTTITAEAKI